MRLDQGRCCGCNTIVQRASMRQGSVECEACAQRRRGLVVAKAGPRQPYLIGLDWGMGASSTIWTLGKLTPAARVEFIKELLAPEDGSPPLVSSESAIELLKSDMDAAMAKLENPEPKACEHGEFFGCTDCFNAALGAWCPKADASPAFFGVDRSANPGPGYTLENNVLRCICSSHKVVRNLDSFDCRGCPRHYQRHGDGWIWSEAGEAHARSIDLDRDAIQRNIDTLHDHLKAQQQSEDRDAMRQSLDRALFGGGHRE